MLMTTIINHILFPPKSINQQKLQEQLEGKTVLITGASSGIGEQLAYLLAHINVYLILVGRKADKLQAMKNEIELKNAKVSIFAVDLRIEDELQSLIQFIKDLPKGLDIVVSNAGHSIKRSIVQSLDRFHDFSRTMAINYSAPVKLMLAVIPLLKQNCGHIVNISTINVLLHPFPYWAAYQASKSAFNTWFLSATPELNRMGILTTSIYLPLVRTPMILPTKSYNKFPAMSPQHVAKIIAKSFYTYNARFKPWWIIFGQFASFSYKHYLIMTNRIRLKKGRKQHKNV